MTDQSTARKSRNSLVGDDSRDIVNLLYIYIYIYICVGNCRCIYIYILYSIIIII